jgi:hypothetical protein
MKQYSEVQAKSSLKKVLDVARETVSKVSDAYNQDWEENPSTVIRAVLGYWVVSALRHFVAIITLCEEHDLSMVADSHYRQILEIQLQIRYFLSGDADKWEVTAQKVSAYGCVEYLEKLESVKDHPSVVDGYYKAQEQLKKYDPHIITEIKQDRSKGKWYWFGKSFSKIAGIVSREGEDLKTLYQLQSADMHGSWGLTFGVSNPKLGSLDFRGYPDKATMYVWAADSLDLATQTFVNIWNDVATAVGAPIVK